MAQVREINRYTAVEFTVNMSDSDYLFMPYTQLIDWGIVMFICVIDLGRQLLMNLQNITKSQPCA